MHYNAIMCGQGAPSMSLIVLAGQKKINADIVIVSDTGWENDMLWSTGERSTAQEYFERVTKPIAESYGIPAYFNRSKTKDGEYRAAIPDMQKPLEVEDGKIKYTNLDLPLFGSNGGRLRQTCTDKWKIKAANQLLRNELGAKTAWKYFGISIEERHRMKPAREKWARHEYPLVGMQWTKVDCRKLVNSEGIPYLISTECDGCPHKDWPRWARTQESVINELAKMESTWQGQFFFTSQRVPLKIALPIMQSEYEARERNRQQQTSFLDEESEYPGCDSGYCFI